MIYEMTLSNLFCFILNLSRINLQKLNDWVYTLLEVRYKCFRDYSSKEKPGGWRDGSAHCSALPEIINQSGAAIEEARRQIDHRLRGSIAVKKTP